MTLQYEIGDPEKPRGHALVYFTRAGEPDSVLATDIVVLPSSVDVTKYILFTGTVCTGAVFSQCLKFQG